MGYELLLIIFIAFLVLSLFLKIRTNKKWKIIQPDDELSRKQKYKASYFAYFGSLFIMMFLIILAPRCSNPRSIILGGLLLMIIIGMASKLLVTIEMDEKQD